MTSKVMEGILTMEVVSKIPIVMIRGNKIISHMIRSLKISLEYRNQLGGGIKCQQ
jgi:hypothetical protein